MRKRGNMFTVQDGWKGGDGHKVMRIIGAGNNAERGFGLAIEEEGT